MASTQESLEAHVRALEDKEEILALMMEYGRCLDRKDWEPYADLFAEDGVLNSLQGVGRANGRAEIRALFGKTLKDVPATAFHLFSNIAIDVDGDTATARSFWIYMRPGSDGAPEILQFGQYRDRLKRENGRWTFELREITRALGHPPYVKEQS